MTRWSHDIETVIRLPATTWPSLTTGTSRTAPTARMPASGGLMIAVNRSMPIMPRFDTLNVEPVISCALSPRFFARSARSRTSAAIEPMPF